jgi:hypothetical protein
MFKKPERTTGDSPRPHRPPPKMRCLRHYSPNEWVEWGTCTTLHLTCDFFYFIVLYKESYRAKITCKILMSDTSHYPWLEPFKMTGHPETRFPSVTSFSVTVMYRDVPTI